MNTTPLARRARVEAARLLPWIERRLSEKSTWTGAAVLLVALGFPHVAEQVTGLSATAIPILATLGAGLAAASTTPRPPAAVPIIVTAPLDTSPKGRTMSFITVARKIFGVIAVAVAPTWDKTIANALAQAEATLVPLLGDDAKKLCEDAASTADGGFVKLAHVVADLATIAANKGIKADYMVLTVIAAKAYAQVKADAPALLDVAIETGITAAAGPAVAALTAPVVEAGVAAATGTAIAA